MMTKKVRSGRNWKFEARVIAKTLLSIFDAIAWLSLLLMVFIAVVFSLRSFRKGSLSISLSLVPFLVSGLGILVGYFTASIAILKVVAAANVFFIIILAVGALRVACNPGGYFEEVAESLIKKGPSGWLTKFVKQVDLEADVPSQSADQAQIKMVTILAAFVNAVPEVLERLQLPLLVFLLRYFLSICLTVGMFAVVFRVDLPSASYHTLFLASVFRFTGSDFYGILGNELPNRWILAFEGIIAYFYVVITILAFSMSFTLSTENLKKRLQILLKREWDMLAETHVKEISASRGPKFPP